MGCAPLQTQLNGLAIFVGARVDLPILMYHHLRPDRSVPLPFTITVSQFQRELRALRSWGFETVTFAVLFRAMTGERPLPRRPVIITFDDGYQSFHTYALPRLRELQMAATVFVVAGEIGGNSRWDTKLGTPSLPLMNENQIKDAIGGGIEIGSHSWSHRDLSLCSVDEASDEILRSKRHLQSQFQCSITIFSYPYGHYNASLFPVLRQSGYHGAVSIFSDAPTVTSDPYAMRRVYIHDGDSLLRFRLKLTRLYLRYAARRGNPFVAKR